MTDYTGMYELLDSIQALFDTLLETEGKKLDALVMGDLALLDEYMKQEQAHTLRLRGLDQKRESLQKELGHEGETLREMIAGAAPDDALRLQQAYEAFGEKTARLNAVIAACKEHIDVNLKSIDGLLARQAAAGYAQTGEQKGGPAVPRFTAESV